MRRKYIVGLGVLLVAAVYLVTVAIPAGAQYFYTIEEIMQAPEQYKGKRIRVSGAVLGDSIRYDMDTLELRFVMVHIPGDVDEIEDQGGLAKVLHDAVNDPRRPRLEVVYVGPKPDLLRHEAQAIAVGVLDDNGVFRAEELLLKCPTRYEEAKPTQ